MWDLFKFPVSNGELYSTYKKWMQKKKNLHKNIKKNLQQQNTSFRILIIKKKKKSHNLRLYLIHWIF
jgi:hypothetical protein